MDFNDGELAEQGSSGSGNGDTIGNGGNVFVEEYYLTSQVYDRDVEYFPKREHFSATDHRKLCAYGGGERECFGRPLKNYEFCQKHILQDPIAPFLQCCYVVNSTKKRCQSIAPNDQEEPILCHYHRQILGLVPKGSKGMFGSSHQRPQQKQLLLQQQQPLDGGAANVDVQFVDSMNTAAAAAAVFVGADGGEETGDEGEFADALEQEDPETSDEEFVGMTPLSHDERLLEQLRQLQHDSEQQKGQSTSSSITTKDMLKLRKEKIEALMHIYYKQYSMLKSIFKAKYMEFLNQRAKYFNSHLHLTEQYRVRLALRDMDNEGKSVDAGSVAATPATVEDDGGDVDGDSLILSPNMIPDPILYDDTYYTIDKQGNFTISNTKNDQLKLKQQHQQQLVPQAVAAVNVTRTVKYDSTGRRLCEYEQCTEKKMLMSDFCFKHILFDKEQQLFVPSQPGLFLSPVFVGTHEFVLLNSSCATTTATQFISQPSSSPSSPSAGDYQQQYSQPTGKPQPLTPSQKLKILQLGDSPLLIKQKQTTKKRKPRVVIVEAKTPKRKKNILLPLPIQQQQQLDFDVNMQDQTEALQLPFAENNNNIINNNINNNMMMKDENHNASDVDDAAAAGIGTDPGEDEESGSAEGAAENDQQSTSFNDQGVAEDL